MADRSSQHTQPPHVGSIQQGRVVRIEDYGAFVQLQGFVRQRGLVHISQLASMRVEKVTDVVDMEDNVWVKVVEVEEQPSDGPPRYKIRLSMKDVPQDGTAPEVHQAELQAKKLSSSLEQNLNSTIGMGIARDPMASNSRLILKNPQDKQPKLINGYALLEDDDDDLDRNRQPPGEPTGVHDSRPAVPPVGRGRGATLPAWMVQQQQQQQKNAPTSTEVEDRSDRRDRKKRKKEKRSRHRHGSKKHSSSRREHGRRKRHGAESDDDSAREQRDAKKRRSSKRGKIEKRDSQREGRKNKSRSLSSSDRSSQSGRRHGRGDTRQEDSHSLYERRRKRRNSPEPTHRERMRQEDDSGSHRSESDIRFHSVEEAKKLIDKIESRRKEM